MFLQIQPKIFLKCFLNLETSNDNNNPDYAIVMQGCSGFVRHAIDIHSIFLLV